MTLAIAGIVIGASIYAARRYYAKKSAELDASVNMILHSQGKITYINHD